MATFNLNYTNLEDIYVVIDGVGRLSLNSTAKTFSFQNPQGIVTLEGACTDSIDNNYHFFWLNGYLGLFKYYAIDLGNGISKWQFEGDVPLVASNPTPQPEPQPTPTPSTDVDTSMGANYYEEDLTTNVKKYFAESFKFDGSQFEMDGDRIVGLKQSFIDTLATDLTNIVNTSISTATLTADTATINQTLTALGINTDLLKTKDLRLVDPQGHEHKLHLGN